LLAQTAYTSGTKEEYKKSKQEQQKLLKRMQEGGKDEEFVEALFEEEEIKSIQPGEEGFVGPLTKFESVPKKTKEKLGIETEKDWSAIEEGWEALTPERQNRILNSDDTPEGRRQSVMIEKNQWFDPKKASTIGENLELLQIALKAAPDAVEEFASATRNRFAGGVQRFMTSGAGLIPLPGTVERKLVRSSLPVIDREVLPVIEVWTVADQQPMIELAKAFGQDYVPQTEVILNLSNMNLYNFEEVLEYIENEKVFLRRAIKDKGGSINPRDTLESLIAEQAELLEGDLSTRVLEIKSSILKLKIKLAGLDTNNVTVLLLARNHFTELPNYIFQNFPKVRVLDLGSNLIEYVGDYAFGGLNKLFFLSLSDNPQLEELPPSALKDAKNSLRWLSLTKTRLGRRVNLTKDRPYPQIAKRIVPRAKSAIEKLNLRKRFLFKDEQENFEALKKALPKAHIRTIALFSRTLMITMAKQVGIVLIAALVYTQSALIAYLFGINLGNATGLAAVKILIKKLTIMFAGYAGYHVITVQGILKPKAGK
jgi:hypothetical protein